MHKYIDPISCYLFAFLCVQYPKPKHKKLWRFIHCRFVLGIIFHPPYYLFSTPTPYTKISAFHTLAFCPWHYDRIPNDISDNKILAQPRKAMKIKFHCQGNRKNLAITVFRSQTLHTLFSNHYQRTGGLLLFCTVFRVKWLIELIYYSELFTLACHS